MEDYRQRLGGRVLVAAHRGIAGGNIPCNSLSGYLAAIRQGADIIELDVTRSLDGTLYCMHPCMEWRFTNLGGQITQMRDDDVRAGRLVNMDGTVTDEHIPLLREAFELLKGKCLINVDKFWENVPDISAMIRELDMREQVIVKSPLSPENLAQVREYAWDMPFMPVLFSDDGAHESLLGDGRIRYVGAELIFYGEDHTFCSPGYIERLHRDGCVILVNPIVYDKNWQLTAGHSDDVSMARDEKEGWGWLIDRGYDILQTDWPAQLKTYIRRCYPGKL